MLQTVRHLFTPSARLASRWLLGTISSTSCVARATIGIIRIASENAPKMALWPCPTTRSPKTKMPTTTAGIPLSTSRMTRSTRETLGDAYSDMKIATSTATGMAMSMAIPTMIALPMRASAMPPDSPKSGRDFVSRSRSKASRPLRDDGPEDEPEDRDREHRRGDSEPAERLLRDPPAPQARSSER